MNGTTITTRLLWKDYRVLKPVWLMCLVGVAALMVLVVVISKTSLHPFPFAPGLWGFAIWVPPVYMLAALATMFAGEREEGTLVWLSVLAPPARRFMFAKLLAVTASSALLQVALGIVAVLLSQLDRADYRRPEDIGEYAFIMSFFLIEGIVWGWFWSLQTSKPLTAILFAAISFVVINSGCVVLTEALGGRFTTNWNGSWGNALGFWGWGRLLLYTGLCVANVRLSERWLQGKPWDWGFVVQWWTTRRVAKTSSTAAMELPEPWQRVWQRLAWLEWQSLKTFGWLIGTVAAIVCAIQLFPRAASAGWLIPTCWLVPLIAGLMAWQGEQSQARFRMLAVRGASPAALWLNKLLLWFSATWAGALFVAVTTISVWYVASWISRWDVRPSLMQEFNLQPRHAAARNLLYEVVAVVGLYGAMQFTLAFACGHLFRKVVIALGTTLAGVVALTIWFSVVATLGLPLWLFLAPIPLWLLWISWSHLAAWWVERTDWRVSGWRWSELTVQALFPLALLGGAAGYRVWEVPLVDVASLQSSSQAPSQAELLRNIAAWRDIARAVEDLQGQPELIEVPSTDAESGFDQETRLDLDPWIEKNRQQLTVLRDKVLAEPFMYPEAAVWVRVRVSRLNHWQLPVDALAKLANDELTADHTDESIKWLQASFRLYGARVAYSDLQMRLTLTTDGEWRQFVYDWAQNPNQSEETLKRGLKAAAHELRFTVWDESGIWQQYLADLRNAQSYWPWEEARRQRRVAVAAINRWTYLQEIRQGRRLPSQAPSEVREYMSYVNGRWEVPDQEAWEFRPAEERWHHPVHENYCLVEGLGVATTSSMQELEGRMRATITVMAVVGYRRLHGKLPTTISELRPFFESHYRHVLTDIWTGREFGYDPLGLALANRPPDTTIVGPFLWSAGPRHVENREQIVAELPGRATRNEPLQSGARIYRIPLPEVKETRRRTE